MKKSIIIGIIVAVVIGSIAAVPIFAAKPNGERAVFESDIVETANHGTPLEKGEVWIRADGSFKVEIEGVDAAPDTVYEVFLRYGFGRGVRVVLLGYIFIDDDGYGELEGYLQWRGIEEETIRSPMIRINEYEDGRYDEMASGFWVPECTGNCNQG
jgi:hypothetical protein